METNIFLLPLIIIVTLFIVSVITATIFLFILSIIAIPVVGILFYYYEKNEIRKY